MKRVVDGLARSVQNLARSPTYSFTQRRRRPLFPGAPIIPFRDLEIQRVENDLVGATFGRGFYVLDDYSALRDITTKSLSDDADFQMYPTRPAKLYIQDRVVGGGRGYQGDNYFAAENPPFGAVFTYFMPEDLKSAKSKRTESEKKLAKAGKDNPTVDWEALRDEENEEEPQLILTIRDSEGELVNRINGSKSKGLHRTAWNLRYGGSPGPLVTPGTYTVEVCVTDDDGDAECASGSLEVTP